MVLENPSGSIIDSLVSGWAYTWGLLNGAHTQRQAHTQTYNYYCHCIEYVRVNAFYFTRNLRWPLVQEVS